MRATVDWPDVKAPIREALAARRPVVALESALITHGFSAPANLKIAQRIEAAVQEEGAVPATIAVLDGVPHIGLSAEQLERLGSPGNLLRKTSLRDLPIVAAQRVSGGTTVAATMHLAQWAGIGVLATGGIGGVHRDHSEDISSDLTALGSIPITVVCSGAKAILDLSRTLEVLETKGVPVVGYGTADFPAFYSRRSGLKVDVAAETPADVARLARMRIQLGLSTAILVCAPVPEEEALPPQEIEAAITTAVAQAEAAGISGKDLTPFLLTRVVELTQGRAQRANEALLVNNARVAARIAQALIDG
ncbi:MAG: pseudouridine-5'-phosphate glycosidase [Anaerolineae bacterium]|jgi:pseudouridine-5'-phosphate glycosidase